MFRLGLFIQTSIAEDEISRIKLLFRSLVCNAPLDDFSEIRIYVPNLKLEAKLRILIQEFEGISGKVSSTSNNTIPQGTWLVITSDVIIIRPWSVQDLLTNCSQDKSKDRGDISLCVNGHRRSLNHLTQVINTPELVFSPLERHAPFLVYPRTTQVCSEIIYDLVKDWIRSPTTQESYSEQSYNQESCKTRTCVQESCKTKACSQESCETKTCERPLISCLMITRDRLNYVKMSIKCFQDQTYPAKELVVISEADDGVEEYVRMLEDSRIRFIRPSATCRTLGQLRNFSLDRARGVYVCQWDDDDWYHPSRLSLQYNVLKEKKVKACLLGQWMLISPLTQQYGVSSFRKEGWEGSILARKDIMPRYPSLKRGEDKALMTRLRKRTRVEVITQPGYWLLYGYLIHQNNTWTNHHFQRILIERIPLSSVYPSSSNYSNLSSTYSNPFSNYSTDSSPCSGGSSSNYSNLSSTYASESLDYENVSKYLAERHLFEYRGSVEDWVPVLSCLVYRITLIWIIVILIIALLLVWVNSRLR